MRLLRTVSPLVVLLLFVTAASAPAQPVADSAGTASFEDVLTAFHEAHRFHGTALVAQGDDVLYEGGFGAADMTWNIPNAPDTRFRIGSVSKQFTAALVLRLAEGGLIDLDAPITTYLPEYPAATGDRITTHHLLTHTSGIPNYTALPGFMEDTSRDPFEPEEFVATFSDLELDFEPGTAWNYSNSGYFLLGVLVEAVTGESFEEALYTRLLDPLGLQDTGYDHYRTVIPRRAEGYVFTGGDYERAPYLDTSIPYAAGMMYSTVRDLHAWNRALYTESVFERPETLMKMLTPYRNDYGYGVGVGDTEIGERSVAAVRHGGGINGFSAQLWYMPDDDYTVVVLDNTAANSGAVADALARVLYDQPQPKPKRSVAAAIGPLIDIRGVRAGIARYRELRETEPEAYDFGENELNGLGYYYLRNGDTDTAIALFELNVEQYPEASNPYDSLGEAYLEAGDRERAVENYERSLELNPGNQNAVQMLKLLGARAEVATVEVAPDVLEGYVGRYPFSPAFAIEITRQGDRLFAQATNQPRFELFPSSETEFFLKVVDAQVTFNRNEAGETESLTLHQNGQRQTAPKQD